VVPRDGSGPRQVFYNILEGRCVLPSGKRSLVVDIGANLGWFAIYSASLRCRWAGVGKAARRV
jgi:hypothetical protein